MFARSSCCRRAARQLQPLASSARSYAIGSGEFEHVGNFGATLETWPIASRFWPQLGAPTLGWPSNGAPRNERDPIRSDLIRVWPLLWLPLPLPLRPRREQARTEPSETEAEAEAETEADWRTDSSVEQSAWLRSKKLRLCEPSHVAARLWGPQSGSARDRPMACRKLSRRALTQLGASFDRPRAREAGRLKQHSALFARSARASRGAAGSWTASRGLHSTGSAV